MHLQNVSSIFGTNLWMEAQQVIMHDVVEEFLLIISQITIVFGVVILIFVWNVMGLFNNA